MNRLFAFALFTTLLALGGQASAQVTLPYFEDFETATAQAYTGNQGAPVPVAGLTGWTILSSSAEGRLRTALGTAFAKSGSRAMTLDRTNFESLQHNFLLLTLDMSKYAVSADNVLLDFSVMHHGEEEHSLDRVWVRGANTDNWVEIFNTVSNDGPSGVYRDIQALDVSAALAGAQQEFSTTFQIRFGQEDNASTVNLTSNDGRTFDDVRLYRQNDNDVGVSAIAAPTQLACGQAATDLIVEITNFGSSPQSMIPVKATVSGAASANLMATLAGPLAPGATTTLTVGQFNAFAGGVVNMDVATALTGDEDPNNDNFKGSAALSPTKVPVPASVSVCPGDPATLAVPSPGNEVYAWYDMAMGGMALSGGASFTTPPVTAPVTYYVGREPTLAKVGPQDNTIGGGGQYSEFGRGLEFDVAQTVLIKTVKVVPGGAGDVVVRVIDSNSNEVAKATVAVTANDAGMLTTLQVDLTVPAGNNYVMDAVGSTVPSMYRNNGGASYPYANSPINITNTTNNLNAYYYFFYDWEFESNGCTGERTAVNVVPDEGACATDLQITKTASAEAVAGSEITYTITVTNNGTGSAAGIEVNDTPAEELTFVKNEGACTTAFPCSVGTLGPGETATITSTFAIAADFSGTVENTATVSSSAKETAPGDESDTASSTVTSAADLSVTITDAPDPAKPGDEVTYTIEVSNAGPSDAAGVAVDLTASAGLTPASTSGCDEDPNGVPSCGLGTIEAGESATFTVVASASEVGVYTMDATVKSDTTDVDMMNNTASAETTINETGTSTSSSSGAGGGSGDGGPNLELDLDSGCGCSTPGQPKQPMAWLWVLAGAALVAARRRRRS